VGGVLHLAGLQKSTAPKPGDWVAQLISGLFCLILDFTLTSRQLLNRWKLCCSKRSTSGSGPAPSQGDSVTFCWLGYRVRAGKGAVAGAEEQVKRRTKKT
jgi:hypothetical protein